jgi:N-acetylneuraminate synthase
MVDRTRELELSLGSAAKCVADNERETVVVQRRCIRAASDLPAGTVLTRAHLEVLRPAPSSGITPEHLGDVVGRRLRSSAAAGEHLRWSMLDEVAGA